MKIRKVLLLTLLLASLSTVFTGCIEKTASSNVNPEAVYQHYFLQFSENQSRFSATARFHVGGSFGTSLELVAPSTVKLDGVPLAKEEFFGVRYSRDWSAPADDRVRTWEWIDQNGNSYINSVRIDRVDHFSRPSSISLSSPLRLEVPGVRESDTHVHYELMIDQQTSEAWNLVSTRGVSSHNAVTFDLPSNQNVKAALRPGSATLRFVKRVESPLVQSTAGGGLIVSVYESKKSAVKLED